jgi:hypothetical protein
MDDQKLLSTLDKLNRQTSLLQFLLIIVGTVLFIINKPISSLLLEILWKYFSITDIADIESFSFKYSIVAILVSFFIVKILFLVIGIIKYFYDKLWA